MLIVRGIIQTAHFQLNSNPKGKVNNVILFNKFIFGDFCVIRNRSGLLFPSPGNLPTPGIEHRSPASQADSLLTDL